jgi:peptidoglycan/xylan/chitin deacetylase (PgdA/CDA1 family)
MAVMTNHQPIKDILSKAFSKIPTVILGKATRTRLIISYYHLVSDDDVIHVKHLYPYKNIRQFEGDLDFLLKKYTPVGLQEILNCIMIDRLLPEKAFLLTFDDGFREMCDVVAPILLRKGIPAIFFINSGFLDNKSLGYQHKASVLIEHLQHNITPPLEREIQSIFEDNGLAFSRILSGILSIKYHQRYLIDQIAQLANLDFDDYLWANTPYLTSSQIMQLIKDGFAIGAHSVDHPLYASLSLEEQLQQTLGSMKSIRDAFSLKYGAFAFPHTDHGVSLRFFEEIYASGIVDISFGTNGMIGDRFRRNLQRVSLEKPLLPAERILALHYARKLFKGAAGRGKITRKVRSVPLISS